MFRTMCKSKLHNLSVTDTQLSYKGSITIDKELLEKADIFPYEKVQVLNINNGERFETYVIAAGRKSGIVCLNGPAARLGQIKDKLLVISYVLIDEKDLKNYKPKIIFVNEKNKIKRI